MRDHMQHNKQSLIFTFMCIYRYILISKHTHVNIYSIIWLSRHHRYTHVFNYIHIYYMGIYTGMTNLLKFRNNTHKLFYTNLSQTRLNQTAHPQQKTTTRCI